MIVSDGSRLDFLFSRQPDRVHSSVICTFSLHAYTYLQHPIATNAELLTPTDEENAQEVVVVRICQMHLKVHSLQPEDATTHEPEDSWNKLRPNQASTLPPISATSRSRIEPPP